MITIQSDELGYRSEQTRGINEMLPVSIRDLVSEYVASGWHKEPVPYDRSFIAFLNDYYPERRFEPISDEKWERINNLIRHKLNHG